MCLIVVGALAPLCFLFSVFQNARPPATPRWLGPPLTQRSKNVGLACRLYIGYFRLEVLDGRRASHMAVCR